MNEIFLDDKSIILTNVQENIENEKYFRLKDVSLDEIIEALSHKGVERIYLYHPNTEKLMKKFKQLIPTIKAGGGIVYNQEGKVLLIKRNGKWDLPKGKKEKGENIATCALREVEEETGGKAVVEKFLFSLPNEYVYSDFIVHTTDLFFLCQLLDETALIAHDDAAALFWIPLANIRPSNFGLASIAAGVQKLLDSNISYTPT